MDFKKLIYPLLAFYLSLFSLNLKSAPLGRYASSLPKGYSELQGEKNYRTSYKNNQYTGTLVSGGRNGAAWFVYDIIHQEAIGDEVNERSDYSELAQIFEIGRFDDLNPDYPATLRGLSRDLKIGLAEYEVVYKIPNSILEKGSRLEGILVGIAGTGGQNLSAEVQSKIITEIVKQESADIITDFRKRIIGDRENINPVELAEKLKKYLEQTIEYKIINSSRQLENAANLFETYDNNWNYRAASTCINDWMEGHTIGIASVHIMDDLINHTDWGIIAKKISSNFANGYTGVPISQIATNLNLKKNFFEDEEVQAIFNRFDEYLSQQARLFSPALGRFRIDDRESPASKFLNSEWPKKSGGAEQVVLNFVRNMKNLSDINSLSNFFSNQRNIPYYLPGILYKNLNNPPYVMSSMSRIYSCRNFVLVPLSSNVSNAVIHLKPREIVCDDSVQGYDYRGEIFYLKNINGTWKITEIVDLSKEGLRERAKNRLSDMVTQAIATYAETNEWPRPFAPEPRNIPDFNGNNLGVQCNVPLYERRPSSNRCFFSYTMKPGRINIYDHFIIEAVGNLDADSDLEIMQIGVGSKYKKQISRD